MPSIAFSCFSVSIDKSNCGACGLLLSILKLISFKTTQICVQNSNLEINFLLQIVNVNS